MPGAVFTWLEWQWAYHILIEDFWLFVGLLYVWVWYVHHFLWTLQGAGSDEFAFHFLSFNLSDFVRQKMYSKMLVLQNTSTMQPTFGDARTVMVHPQLRYQVWKKVPVGGLYT